MATIPHVHDSSTGNAARAPAFARFRALVLADEALQARLGAIERPDRYVAEAVAVAAEHGIVLAAETIDDAILPMGRPKPHPMTLDRWPSRGWLPVRAVETGAAPAFDWAWFGAQALDAPFYEDMIRRFAARPFNRMFPVRTDLATLVDASDAAAGPPPAGFVHHLSRCGSTLVAQMLGADPHHVVLSEPAPLDAVVRWALGSGVPLDDQVAALRAIVAALGRDRSGQTRRVVFKLDSWHSVALPLFRAAFPETPWVFLYRDPVEILVSHRRQRGSHTVAGLLPASIVDIPGGATMAADHYAACVLKTIGEAILDHGLLDHGRLDHGRLDDGSLDHRWPGGGLLVDYAEMPDAIIDRIAPHFGFVPDAAQRGAMMQVATRSAKAPGQRFAPDTAAKRRAATPEIEAARALVDPVHARLEALRKSSVSSPVQSIHSPRHRY